MARPKIPEERKVKEGLMLEAHFNAAQERDPSLTQDSVAQELGLTQGLISQWIKGKTNIPDKTLIWLGKRLGFDSKAMRPELMSYSDPNEDSTSTLLEVTGDMPPESVAKVVEYARFLKSSESTE